MFPALVVAADTPIDRQATTSNPVRRRQTSFEMSRRPHLIPGCAILLALVASPGAHGQSPVDQRIGRVENGLLSRAVLKGETGKRASIAERMAYHGIPGMSMAVIEDGKLVGARAYGLRGRETGGPVTPDTLFQAASVSKPVTAFGVILLAQQGRLDLDGDVRQWLKSWTPGEAITLRQLLSHTAGLTVSGFGGYTPGAALPTVPQILNGQRPANNEPVRVANRPGGKVEYSGGGYVVVQQLITDVTGLLFDEHMRNTVFTPLNMSRSHFEQPLSRELAQSTAFGHHRDGAKLEDGWMVHPELAPAGLWTTPTDLARLIIEVQDAAAGRPSRVLKPEWAREMLTGRVDNAGLGFFLSGPNGSSRRFMHSGRNAGFDALLVAYKNGRQGAVVMINRNNNGGFINEVLESVAREYHWPDYVSRVPQQEYEPVSASIQASYAGTYDALDRPRLTIIFEDGKLFARAGEDPWFRMYPSSESEFFAVDKDTRWTFVKTPGGIQEVIARTGNNEVHRRRLAQESLERVDRR
jgi:CubicO group peptidase (beta-lactamase class C family)